MAIQFDNNDYASNTSYGSVITALPFSLAFWAKCAGSAAYTSLASLEDNSGSSWGLTYNSNLRVARQATYTADDTGIALPDTNWHSYVVVFTSTQSRVSVDGATFADLSHTNSILTFTRVRMGYAVGFAGGSTRDIFDYRVYNIELTQANSVSYYNSGSGDGAVALSTGLVDHWKAEDNTDPMPNEVAPARTLSITGNPTTTANPFEFGAEPEPTNPGPRNLLTLGCG